MAEDEELEREEKEQKELEKRYEEEKIRQVLFLCSFYIKLYF